jgi:hypothetical protein
VANFVSKMFGEKADQSADKTLAFAAMAAAAASAQAYFTAALQSTTSNSLSLSSSNLFWRIISSFCSDT